MILISTEILQQYDFQNLQHDGRVYLEIEKIMYDLKESEN